MGCTTFLPLLLRSVYHLARNGNVSHTLASAFSAAWLILNHTLTAFFGLPLATLYALAQSLIHKRRQVFRKIGLMWLITLTLTAFYWLPAWAEIKWVRKSAGTPKK